MKKKYLHISRNIVGPFALIALLLTISHSLSAQFSTISGQIVNPEGFPLENASVILSGDDNQVTLTDADGNYQFQILDGSNFVVTPKNNSFPLQGVSTLDLVILERHLTGVEPIDNPYKFLAADVNNDLSINSFDAIDLEKMIIGTTSNFPNNTSWRFINAGQVFLDPQNPFNDTIEEEIGINIAQSNANDVNFIGIKVGDLNWNAPTVLTVDPCNIGCSVLSGTIGVDQNLDCQDNDVQNSNSGWTIALTSTEDTLYTTTNVDGEYFIEAPEGQYNVFALPKNHLWTFCENDFLLTLEEGQTYVQNFLTQAIDDCHLLNVDFSYSFLRRCFETPASLSFCNDGTTTAYDLEITVTLDSFQTITSSSIPWTSLVDNTFTFETDSLAANTCETIYLTLETSCDAELEQTLCANTEITPFSDCFAPANWDGSDLTVDVNCLGEDVEFTIVNTGAPMTKALEYIIIEDDMIMMINNDGNILQPQETMSVPVSANGSTWRIEVDQADNHPFMEKISAAIEGCGTNSNGEVSRGFINQFPLITNSKSTSINCETVVGSFDPNDKTGFPRGVHEEHFIEKNTNIDYLIRFQNTGTDTAFTVVLRDTISEHLDITSIVPGAGSHDYRFNLMGSNIVEFTFPNIMLPDSFVNEPASNGFIKFEIAQKEDLPIGTRIENSAAIYFDFNEPVITNTTFHTIGENFLEIINSTSAIPNQLLELAVAPNPMTEVARIEVLGKTLLTGSLELFDLNGRQVASVSIQDQRFEIHRNDLPAGMFFFKIIEEGVMIGSGKLMITD